LRLKIAGFYIIMSLYDVYVQQNGKRGVPGMLQGSEMHDPETDFPIHRGIYAREEI
jgi:hypothetical protein